MKTATHTVTITTYTSEVLPSVASQSTNARDLITWADAHPVVWKIVTSTRSKAFGRKSSRYIGWAQGSNAPEAILERVRTFWYELEAPKHVRALAQWSARFTFDHYDDKGFKGGFFQQFDGSYPRNCMTLDYTPKTRDAVIDQFITWCDHSACRYETREIWIDKRCVRKLQVKHASPG